MSDALAKTDAQDVLASIRRLVVDHPAPPPAPERLLLTPALRVVEPAPVLRHAPPPAVHDLRDSEEGNETTADDAAIARLLRRFARNEAPAILAETLAQSCGAAVTEAANAVVDIPQAVTMPPVFERPASVAAVETAAPQQAALPDDPVPSQTALPETALADEAFLREIVADVLRQELQGELGERITRNMRKLVRREIHRALSALDYE